MPIKEKPWPKDPKVIEWFQLLGNKRTIFNYSRDFGFFIEFVQKNTARAVVKVPAFNE